MRDRVQCVNALKMRKFCRIVLVPVRSVETQEAIDRIDTTPKSLRERYKQCHNASHRNCNLIRLAPPREMNLSRQCVACTLLLLGAAFSTVNAHEVQHAGLMVKHPWVRAAPAGSASTVAAGKISNQGKSTDRLIGAKLEGTEAVLLFKKGSDVGVPLSASSLTIAPGETVVLSTDGTHLRFTGLSKTLDEDTYVDGELIFEKAGRMTIDFYVEPLPSGVARQP